MATTSRSPPNVIVPVYSVNRRRAIVLLVLSSILLLTLDLRGNPLIDRVRSAFARVLEPFETASEVVATPIKNAWHGATDYDDLQRENEYLRESGRPAARRSTHRARCRVRLAGTGHAQRVARCNIDRVTARVVGGAPGNFEQTVEIDRGSDDEIRVGMAVVNAGGLVGKITKVYCDRSVVRLVTDADYTIECKVSAFEAVAGAETDADATDDRAARRQPTRPPRAGLIATISARRQPPPHRRRPPPQLLGPQTRGPRRRNRPARRLPRRPPLRRRRPLPLSRCPSNARSGGCEGRGPDRLPAMRFVTENPVFGGQFGVGDVITTAGGSKSTAPAGLIIGEVINVVEPIRFGGAAARDRPCRRPRPSEPGAGSAVRSAARSARLTWRTSSVARFFGSSLWA